MFIFFCIYIFGFIYSVHALFFERGKTPENEISWFLYPLAGIIDGVEDFYGLGATGSSIGYTYSDNTVVSLRGKAEYFDEDLNIDFLSIFYAPLFSKHLTLTLFSTKNPQRRMA